MTVTAAGFAQYAQDVEIRSALGVNVKVSFAVASSTDTVTVEAGGGSGGERSDWPHRRGSGDCSTRFPWKASPHR